MQVDPDVLRELPLDIRTQIEKEMKTRKETKAKRKVESAEPRRSSARLSRGNSQQAGCSHWAGSQTDVDLDGQVKVTGSDNHPEKTKDVESIPALPAYSQVKLELTVNCLMEPTHLKLIYWSRLSELLEGDIIMGTSILFVHSSELLLHDYAL